METEERIAALERQVLELREMLNGAFGPAVQPGGHPSHNALFASLRDFNPSKMNIKFFGYELARSAAAALPIRKGLQPAKIGLKSKATTQVDLESDWAAYWLSELGIPVMFHRKLWELAYALQAFYEYGCLGSGLRALGFGCGEEAIPSYLASHGVHVTVTDLAPDEVMAAGWANSAQHTGSLEHVFRPHLVKREDFERLVSLRYVDMNAIPPDLVGYDFCWSICALEHLGSIAKGLDFIENSIGTLKPGGLAVHTTEFNFWSEAETIDNWGTVLFQRAHFEEIASRLRSKGHYVSELDFDVGSKPVDMFIDLPPYQHDWSPVVQRLAVSAPHLKLLVDGFPSTCFGLIVRRGG